MTTRSNCNNGNLEEHCKFPSGVWVWSGASKVF